MALNPYFGTYCIFNSTCHDHDYALMGADSLVGDLFTVEFKNEDGELIAMLTNKFGQEVGELDRKTARKLLLIKADGWEIRAIMASVIIFKDEQKNTNYGGEAAIICFPGSYSKEFDNFTAGIASEIAEGRRPVLKLSDSTVKNIIEAEGKLVPKDKEPRLKLTNGSVIVKDHMKTDEKMVELARKRNPGCMFVGYAFIAVLVALAIYALYHLVQIF